MILLNHNTTNETKVISLPGTERKVVFVVPCYNEAHRLDSAQFVQFARQHPTVHFIFVDDGSRDRTRELLLRMHDQLPKRIELLVHKTNGGKGEAVRSGFQRAFEIDPDIIGFWDADLSTPVSAIKEFITFMAENPHCCAVLGSRIKILGRKIERRAGRHYLGRVFATFASMTLNAGIYDTQAGAKAFRNTGVLRKVFSESFKSRWIFDVEILARCKVAGISLESQMAELPLRAWNDVRGSKVNALDFFVALKDLVRIWLYLVKTGAWSHQTPPNEAVEPRANLSDSTID